MYGYINTLEPTENSYFLIFLFFYLFIMVAVAVVCVILCNLIAKNKGLSKSYKWFGLLGVIGIIVVAVISPPRPFMPPMPNYYTPHMPPQPYQAQQPVSSSTQTGSDVPKQKFCQRCGTSVDAGAAFCSNCGNRF